MYTLYACIAQRSEMQLFTNNIHVVRCPQSKTLCYHASV